MVKLPAVGDLCAKRPGRFKTKSKYAIPNMRSCKRKWNEIYSILDASDVFHFPIEDMEEKINPFFGYFGYRWHPINQVSKYFHIGVDIIDEPKTEVYPIADGVLEYSGYDIVNGNYIVLSHPNIVTEDGYVLHSVYMHLRNRAVNFTSYQKMLREISLHTYPEIEIKRGMMIGELGDTGNPKGILPHMHLEIHLVKKKEGRIAIDPVRVLGILQTENKTRDIRTSEDFLKFAATEKDSLKEWGLEQIIEPVEK